MEVNYWTVIASAVFAMIIGAIWYGPLFGKQWLRVIGADKLDEEGRKKMQKEAGPLYLIQFLLALFQIYVLAFYLKNWGETPALEVSLWIWGAFVIPTLAGSAMWNNQPRKQNLVRFLIQGGYQLVIFAMFGLILGAWM